MRPDLRNSTAQPPAVEPQPPRGGRSRSRDGARFSRRQRGLTLIGLLFSGIIIALIALVVMRVVPTVIEYFNIKKAVVRATSASPSGLPSEIRTAFDRSQAIDDFSAVAAKDLVITKVNDQTVVSFAYEKRVPLFGPASLLIEYKGDSRSN
jgi:Domain of unknown function (DUF4845)